MKKPVKNSEKELKEKSKLDTKTKDKLSKGKQDHRFEDDVEYVGQANSIKSS